MWGHCTRSTDPEYSEQVAVSNDENIAFMTKNEQLCQLDQCRQITTVGGRESS
jgi:hypothetical protein